MDQRSFATIKENFFNKMTTMKKDLGVKSAFYWGFLSSQENIFNKKTLKEYIDRLTLNDLSHFTDKIVERRLSIQVANTNTKYERIDKESIYITEIDYFKKFVKFGRPEINENESEKKSMIDAKPVMSLRLDLNKAFRRNNQIYKN
jgi:hypothetical protein